MVWDVFWGTLSGAAPGDHVRMEHTAVEAETEEQAENAARRKMTGAEVPLYMTALNENEAQKPVWAAIRLWKLGNASFHQQSSPDRQCRRAAEIAGRAARLWGMDFRHALAKAEIIWMEEQRNVLQEPGEGRGGGHGENQGAG